MKNEPITMAQRVEKLAAARQAKRQEMAQYVTSTHYVSDMVDAATHKACQRLVASSKVADIAARKRLASIDLTPTETQRVSAPSKGKGADAAATA